MKRNPTKVQRECDNRKRESHKVTNRKNLSTLELELGERTFSWLKQENSDTKAKNGKYKDIPARQRTMIKLFVSMENCRKKYHEAI